MSLSRLHPAEALTGIGLILALGACAATESGQTGSPVYESPSPELPEDGGGISGEGNDNPAPEVLPEPPPVPSESALVGSHLLVAGSAGLAIYDVASPQAPLEVGRLALEGEARLLRADSLGRVAVSLFAPTRYTGASIPNQPLPSQVWRVLEVDATDPSRPSAGSSFNVPAGSAAVLADAAGYTVLGGQVEQRERGCGLQGEIDIVRPPARVLSLWLERFEPAGGALVSAARRELPAGHFRISSDQSHVIALGVPASDMQSAPFDVSVIEPSSLATVFSTVVSPSELGASAQLVSADYAQGVLTLAGGSRLLAFDTASAQPLAPLATSAAIHGLRFMPGGELLALDGDSPRLVRLNRGAAPSLSLVPLAAGTPALTVGPSGHPGSFQPFGAGFIVVSGPASANGQSLRAASYAINAAGELEAQAALQTSWPFSTNWYGGIPWRIDAARERLSYALPTDDSDLGRAGLIALIDGQLVRSELVTTARLSMGPLLSGEAAYAVAGGTLQALTVEASPSGVSLEAQPPITVALSNVRREVEHAGRLWTAHRKDTGETSLMVRSRPFDEPRSVNIPHAVENLVPVGDSHLLVFGFWVSGQCDTLLELDADTFPECGPDSGNGVSIVAADAVGARVVQSFPLSSFMEGRPPEGIEQSLDWHGYFQVDDSKWALLARFHQGCSSVESCEALGVPAYTSFGTSGCGPGQECDTSVREFVSGGKSESWLFTLDVSNPAAPELSPAIRGGGQSDIYEAYDNDLGNALFHYENATGGVWGYPVETPVYNAQGNSVVDAHGNALSRWYVQLIETSGGGVSFGEQVNLPGAPVGLVPGAGAVEPVALTLEPAYRSNGDQYMQLHQTRIEAGYAFIEQSLDVGRHVAGAQASEGLIALLRAPEEFCSEGANYELVVADLRSEEPRLSAPLVLGGPPDYGWGLSAYDRASEPAGVIFIVGGPAPGGRLVVDISSDPPSIIRYETP